MKLKMKNSIRVTIVIISWVMTFAVFADVKLPAVISDKMVLQQGMPAPIWGQATPGEKVTVTYAGQTKQATADAKGKWIVHLDSLKALPGQAGQDLTIKGNNTIILKNVLIGEVWICSGQSNMQWSVNNSNNSDQEIAQANYPEIRLFTVACRTAPVPQSDCLGEWKICSPKTVGNFSAVGYFFGRSLYQSLKIPIGLINTSWGGTVAEAWTSAEALQKNLPEFNEAIEKNTSPDNNLKKAIVKYKEDMIKYKESFKKLYELESDLAGAAKFAAPDFDDSSWLEIKAPGNWESRGLFGVDGIVWYRKTLDIPKKWTGKDIILRPGPIDEVDVCWFNGKKVDSRGSIRTNDVRFWNKPREYRVPGELVKPGKNVVAFRVIDACGQGGLWGAPAKTMFVEVADKSDKKRISLAGKWRVFPQYKLPKRPRNPNHPNRPTVLFNAMINPLIPFGIRGAIWYQGESNASRAEQYRKLLPTMISDWRKRWGLGDFTFLIVQLANFMRRETEPRDTNWAQLREAQALTVTELPKVGLAVTIDIGEAKDIHPRNKQDVGKRLAMAGRAIAYDQKLIYSGPVYKNKKVKGNKVELTFDFADGLKAKGKTLTGFAICGPDKEFVWAKAKIEGDKVIVWSDKVKNPVDVRYAWGNNPDCNLYNGVDLPAVPFRTGSE